MSRLLNRALAWWSGRTVRERHMLRVMAALLLTTAVWLGVVRPVLDWRTAAAERVEAASATLVDVRTAVAALGPSRAPSPAPTEGLEPLIRRTAEAAGLDVVTAMSASGQLGFQLSRVQSGPLFGWLSALETDHRLVVCSLGVVENTDATVNVEGAFSVGACAG